ncbi:interferon-induced protein 44-like [Brachyhypopomus gauderio]|uniref:interferon-induced protein 44-like n=1 Tax=Brachyhypopomus gauderio TaxID=698409 RepID=UPI004042DB78
MSGYTTRPRKSQRPSKRHHRASSPPPRRDAEQLESDRVCAFMLRGVRVTEDPALKAELYQGVRVGACTVGATASTPEEEFGEGESEEESEEEEYPPPPGEEDEEYPQSICDDTTVEYDDYPPSICDDTTEDDASTVDYGAEDYSPSVGSGVSESDTYKEDEEESLPSSVGTYEKYGIGNGRKGMLPLAFNDIMGVEEGKYAGVHTDDIINAMKGHITEGYMFRTEFPITEKDPKYRRNPSLSDRIHCLVSVLGADKITMMGQEFINKMKKVREAASGMGIPQVVFITRVDLACPMTKDNLKKIYRSRKIKEIMNKCSNLLGVPMNCIFPVKNYSDENQVKEDINCLMLDALTQIVHWAHDYVVTCSTIPIIE